MGEYLIPTNFAIPFPQISNFYSYEFCISIPTNFECYLKYPNTGPHTPLDKSCNLSNSMFLASLRSGSPFSAAQLRLVVPEKHFVDLENVVSPMDDGVLDNYVEFLAVRKC